MIFLIPDITDIRDELTLGKGKYDAFATLTKDGTTVILDLTKKEANKHWPQHKRKYLPVVNPLNTSS